MTPRVLQARAELERRQRAKWPSFEELSETESCLELLAVIVEDEGPQAVAKAKTELETWRQENAAVLQSRAYQEFKRKKEAALNSPAEKARIEKIIETALEVGITCFLLDKRKEYPADDDLTYDIPERSSIRHSGRKYTTNGGKPNGGNAIKSGGARLSRHLENFRHENETLLQHDSQELR